MTEPPVSQQTAQEDDQAKACSKGTAKNDTGDCQSDAENGNRKVLQSQSETVQQQHLQTDPDQTEQTRRKPALVRSKTFDHSLLTQVQPDPEAKIERKKSHYSQLSKTNSQYHKIFKEICKEEQLRQSYTCALQKDILYQGRLFVSDNWICFHSKVFGKDTKIAIPVEAVTNIKKTKTAILVPNALVIATTNDRHVFVSFLSRDNTYKYLMSSCLHLEEKSPCSSPVPSAESSFRSQRSPRSPHFPMNFPGDFSDLDGTVRRRRQDTEESSSSDCQTPDYEKLPGFPVPPFLEVLKKGEGPPSADHTEHKVNHQPHNPQNADTKQEEVHYTATKGADVVVDSRGLKPVSLNTLLLVYLFLVFILVLSSCYMALKIISLEQRLTSLGSITDLTQDESISDYLRPELNAEIYSELSLNLMKLEKVQRNLQRLLDEAN